MTTAKLVIMRHGETDYNLLGLITGQYDAPLNAKGEAQAREAGTLISSIRFNKIYSSTLSRTFNTAALALESSQTEQHLQNADGSWQIEQRHEIDEIDAGRFTGLNRDTHPEASKWVRIYDVPWPDGESEKQVVERVQKFFDTEVMPRLMRGENVLIVAHAGVARMFDIVLGLEAPPLPGQPAPKKKVKNAAPTVYEYEDGVMKNLSVLEKKTVHPTPIKAGLNR